MNNSAAKEITMKSRLQSFQRDSQTIYYLIEGEESGPLVTLVNGYARTHTDFRILSKRLVGEGYRVLSLDNRGSGGSKASGSFTLADMALDIVALWDHLSVSSTKLLGISMGGIISQYLAAFDNRVEQLVLVSTTPSKDFIPPEKIGFSEDFQQVWDKMVDYFHPTFVEKNKMLLEAMVKQMVKSAKEGEFVSQAGLQRAALDNFDLSDIDHSRIGVDCLVVHGEDDKIVLPGAADELETLVPSAEKLMYQDCGHLILAEKPAKFYQDVVNFFS